MSNVIEQKSFEYAVRIVNFAKYLKQDKKEFELASKIIKAGTAIGANIPEAIGAISNKEFIAKMQLAYQKSRETSFLLKVIHGSKIIDTTEYNSMYNNADELNKILSSILKTTKNNKNGA